MIRATPFAFALLVATAPVVRAQDAERALHGDDLDALNGTFGFQVSARVGFVGTPYAAPDAGEARGRAASTILRAHYEVEPGVRIGLRVPLLDTSPELPAGSVVTERVVGNPELLGELALPWTETLSGALRVGVGIPIGGGGADPQSPLLTNQAFALVDAVHGGWDVELHAPGRLPLTPAVRLSYHRGLLHAGGALKLPLLFQTRGGGDDPRVDVHPVAFLPRLGGHVALAPIPWLYLTLRTWIAVDAVLPVAVAGRSPTRIDWFVEPQLSLVLADVVVVSATLALAVAGARGGEVIAPGLHVTIDGR